MRRNINIQELGKGRSEIVTIKKLHYGECTSQGDSVCAQYRFVDLNLVLYRAEWALRSFRYIPLPRNFRIDKGL